MKKPILIALFLAACGPAESKQDQSQEKKLEALEKGKENAKQETDRLNELLNSLAERIAELETAQTTDSGNHTALETRVAISENSLSYLSASDSLIAGRVLAVEGSTASQSATMATVRTRVTALETTSTTHAANLNSLQSTVTTHSNAVSTLQNQQTTTLQALSAIAATVSTHSVSLAALMAATSNTELWLYDATGTKLFPATGGFLTLNPNGEVAAWVRLDSIPSPVFTALKIGKPGLVAPNPSEYYMDGNYLAYYLTSDCSGQAYLNPLEGSVSNIVYKPGLLAIHDASTGKAMWSPIGASKVSVTTLSYYTGSTCVVQTSGLLGFPVNVITMTLTFQGPLYVAP